MSIYNDHAHFKGENWTACRRMGKVLRPICHTHFGQMAYSETLLPAAAKVLLTYKGKNLTLCIQILPLKRKDYNTCHISLVICLDCKRIQGRSCLSMSTASP